MIIEGSKARWKASAALDAKKNSVDVSALINTTAHL